MSVEDAIGLALKVMSRTMDSTTLGSEKLEFAVLTYDETAKQAKAKIYKPAEIDVLLKAHELAKKDTEMKS
ncbi:hypothetical protein OG21DRAFT_1494373 [Imleria badia]|nr:hypothetical protein OG21DRAFT_1494373 [Imleria badia]